MTEKTNIPQGYKDSPLGIIPKEWEVKRLGDSFTFKQGVQFPVQEQYLEYKTGLIRFIRIVDLTQGDEPPRYVKDPGIQHHISEQDLFMIRYGTPGVIGYGYVGVIANNLFRLIPKQEIDKYYFYQYFKMLEPELMNLSCSSSMAAINFSTLERVYLRYPTSLQEQNRVSNILRTWDTAIDKQSELIEKLKLRKRALMQQLLTGKKRLPGFSGEWKEVKLGDIGEMFKGCGVPKDSIIEAGHKCLTYGDIYTKYDYVISNVKSYINDDTASKSTKIQYGDICFAGSGETKEDIGKCAAFIDAQYGYAGGDIIIFRAIESNPITLSYILNSDSVIRQKSNMGQGHSVVHIYPYQLEKLRFKLPPKVEQDTIASILMDADKEIELANKKLNNLQSQKRGLMQQLLTGKKRVIKNEL